MWVSWFKGYWEDKSIFLSLLVLYSVPYLFTFLDDSPGEMLVSVFYSELINFPLISVKLFLSVSVSA